MPKILPSQVVEAIDSLFGPNRKELDGRTVTHVYRAEVHALLALLDEVPRELINLCSVDYLELTRCRASSPHRSYAGISEKSLQPEMWEARMRSSASAA